MEEVATNPTSREVDNNTTLGISTYKLVEIC